MLSSSIANLLDTNKLLIATNWVKNPNVNAVLKSRKISAKKFRNAYAIAILEYFISIIREENSAGDCPIMSRLVNYLISQNITPQEVFDICVGFKNAVIMFLLKQESMKEVVVYYIKELDIIFDKNLSGVLNIFTNIYSDTQKKIELAKVQRKKFQQILKIINFINTKIVIVQNSRIILANEPFLRMLGVKNLKEFYQKYEKGFEFLSDVNIYKNDFKVNMHKWIKKVCKNDKPFRCSIYNEDIKKTFNYSGQITNMPDGDENQYIITFNNISGHLKDEKAVQDSLVIDELTGFRNYPSFEKLLSKKIKEARKNNTRLFLAIADIPNLKEINDTYGMKRGDMVISKVAENLRSLIDTNIYIARLEGSRFGILLDYEAQQLSYNWCVELYKKLNDKEYEYSVSITEVDLSESVNKLFLRAFSLVEDADLYQKNLVINDFKDIIEYKELPNQVEFISKLSKYKSIELFIFYKGLSVSSQAKIVAIKKETISLKLSYKQMKVVELNKVVYFNLSNTGNIKAYIKKIDKNNKIITIDRFSFDKHTPLNRELFRIEVIDDIKAYIEANTKEYSIKILDMNYECVAVHIDRKRNFDINSLVFLDMLLPINDMTYSCAFNASITKIQKVSNGYKMVLLFSADMDSKKILKQYIAKCQMSIIKELSK